MSYEPKRFDFSIPIRVNLSSDTQTKPSRAMRQAMMEAEVGDEQMGSDPTVWALCDRTAALLGKEAAVFLPSGTMCNQVAIATHCRPGDEILAHEASHILSSEGGAAAAIAGALVTGLTGERGQFTVDTLERALRPVSRYSPTQRLVEVEQTTNRGGGACWSIEALRAVTGTAHAHGLATHMDGARLMNASVALGVSAADLTAGCDSVWLDFTKGLAAPLGAVLAGSRDFIGQAWRWKQRLGGSMRQGGICAAACLYALEHNIERLVEDHANAKSLARGLAQIPGITLAMPETNLVFFDTEATGMTAEAFAGRLRKEGVLVSTSGKYRVRACLHLDVTAALVEEALMAMKHVVNTV
jgi:threonine aldolase